MESIKVVGGTEAAIQYSPLARRSHFAMTARRAMRKANCSASVILVKPFVVMAARALGPGPLRLRMVKLAHNLGSSELPLGTRRPAIHTLHARAAVQPTRRAA